MEYRQHPVYDIISIVRIRYYTETVIQIFKTYTKTRIRCYIGIISRILADSYRVNKREYGLHVFIESLYNNTRENYSTNIKKILFCIQPHTAQIWENMVQKTLTFTVVLSSV